MYHQNFNGPQEQNNITMDETAAIGILAHLDTVTLGQLMENDAKLDELINDLQQVKNIHANKQNLLERNKSLADYNLSLEPRLLEGRSILADTYEKGSVIQEEFKSLKEKIEELKGGQSLDTTLALLQTEAAKSEEDSEETADKFLEGNLELEDFIDGYGAQRRTAHLRKAKAEKMAELINLQQTNHSSRPLPPQPNYNRPPYYGT